MTAECAYQSLELLDEIPHTHDTVDITRVITKEDTTKCRKGTHEVGLHGDGGLDTRDIHCVGHGVSSVAVKSERKGGLPRAQD